MVNLLGCFFPSAPGLWLGYRLPGQASCRLTDDERKEGLCQSLKPERRD